MLPALSGHEKEKHPTIMNAFDVLSPEILTPPFVLTTYPCDFANYKCYRFGQGLIQNIILIECISYISGQMTCLSHGLMS